MSFTNELFNRNVHRSPIRKSILIRHKHNYYICDTNIYDLTFTAPVMDLPTHNLHGSLKQKRPIFHTSKPAINLSMKQHGYMKIPWIPNYCLLPEFPGWISLDQETSKFVVYQVIWNIVNEWNKYLVDYKLWCTV